jgi:hypothetical protein
MIYREAVARGTPPQLTQHVLVNIEDNDRRHLNHVSLAFNRPFKTYSIFPGGRNTIREQKIRGEH